MSGVPRRTGGCLAWDASYPVASGTTYGSETSAVVDPPKVNIINVTYQDEGAGSQRVGGFVVPTKEGIFLRMVLLPISLVYSPGIGTVDDCPTQCALFVEIFKRAQGQFRMLQDLKHWLTRITQTLTIYCTIRQAHINALVSVVQVKNKNDEKNILDKLSLGDLRSGSRLLLADGTHHTVTNGTPVPADEINHMVQSGYFEKTFGLNIRVERTSDVSLMKCRLRRWWRGLFTAVPGTTVPTDVAAECWEEGLPRYPPSSFYTPIQDTKVATTPHVCTFYSPRTYLFLWLSFDLFDMPRVVFSSRQAAPLAAHTRRFKMRYQQSSGLLMASRCATQSRCRTLEV